MHSSVNAAVCGLKKTFSFFKLKSNAYLKLILDLFETCILELITSISSKKFIKEGKNSLFTKANKMKELGANTKTEILNNQE